MNERLKYNNTSVLKLSDFQVAARDRILDKIGTGYYGFTETDCLCGGKKDILLAEKDRYGLPVRTVLCMVCGLIRSNPKMDKYSLARFYSEDYRDLYVGNKYSMDRFFDDEVHEGHRIYDFICKQKGDILPQGTKVLEVGCGGGGIIKSFMDKGCDVYGCDYGEHYLSYGREKYGLSLFKGGYETFKSSARKADVIILAHVLEHSFNPIEELRGLKDVANPEGLIYINVPGLYKLHHNYSYDFLRYLQNAHNYHFHADTLSWVLGSSGWEVLYVDEEVNALARNDCESGLVFEPVLASKTTRYLKRIEWQRRLGCCPSRWQRAVRFYLAKGTEKLGIKKQIKALLARG